jgi:divalent anion:Na+ symporter, DASS family
MLSTQLQDEFQGMFWFVAALVCVAVMTAGHFALELFFFKGTHLPATEHEKLRLQVSLLGPLRTDEWFALSALALFIFGALTKSWHHVALPWIGGFILVALLLYGLVSKKNFQQYVDWPMVFFLLSLQGITSTMEYLHVVDQLKPVVKAAAAIVNEEFWRVVLVELVVVSIIRLALPITAGAVVSVILLLPLAEITGLNPWIVGFIAAMFADMWFMPYQSSNYAQLRSSHTKAEMFNESLFLRYNLATCAVRVLAVFASIPYWQYLGLA